MAKYLLLFLSLHSWVEAQQFQSKLSYIQGKIVSHNNGQPLPYAHIYSPSSKTGTVSNAKGEYVLKLPYHTQTDTLIVTFIGYKTAKIPYKHSDTLQTIIISLVTDVVTLPEIAVTGLDEIQLLNKLWRNIPVNYGTDAYITRGFYREWTKDTLSDVYYAYSEGIIDMRISMADFQKDSVKIVKGITYKSDSIVYLGNKSYPLPEITEGPYIGIWTDALKNPDLFIYNLAHYKFKIINITSYQDRNVYVLSFTPKEIRGKGKFKGKIYIDSQTFALVKTEFSPVDWVIAHYNTYLRGYLLEKRTYLTEYSFMNDHWYLKFTTVENTYQLGRSKIRLFNKMLFSSTEPFRKEFEIFARNKNNITQVKSFTNLSKSLESQDWYDYNIIESEK